jgi:hypothetical protein
MLQDGTCEICGHCEEDRKLHVQQLHGEVMPLRAEVERLKEAVEWCGSREAGELIFGGNGLSDFWEELCRKAGMPLPDLPTDSNKGGANS